MNGKELLVANRNGKRSRTRIVIGTIINDSGRMDRIIEKFIGKSRGGERGVGVGDSVRHDRSVDVQMR